MQKSPVYSNKENHKHIYGRKGSEIYGNTKMGRPRKRGIIILTKMHVLKLQSARSTTNLGYAFFDILNKKLGKMLLREGI